MGNTAKQCRLGLFQDSDFAGDLEDSKSTSGGTLCVLGSHTFVPISWMCKKQTAVSHSSTESEIISLDTGLRLAGLPALELWDQIVSVLRNVSHISDRTGMPIPHRPDFKQAWSTLRQFKDKEDEAQRNQRWTQSYSSSWWNWQGSSQEYSLSDYSVSE